MDDNTRGKAQYASFYMGSTEDDAATAKEGRPIFKDVPFVIIHVAGDKDLVINQPVWDDPSKENSHTSRFPEEWRRFKQGMDADAQQGGTPLALMPGITNGQVREMAYFHVKTVEQLAEMSDGNAQKFPGVQKLRAEARAYIERAQGAAPEKRLQAELAARDNELDSMRKQMQQQAAQIAKLMGEGGDETLTPSAPATKAKRVRA